ncbi:hypothetical protein BY996DRAFT_6419428 [Phakopsora pachyrhizi]|nr:hypothetical protein BY996DRAFT_6419428 [Phakopsora pachyrhizi]
MTLDGKAIVACPLRLLPAPLGTCLAGIDSVLKKYRTAWKQFGQPLLWPYPALGKSTLALWAKLYRPNLENLVWSSLVHPTLALVDFHAFVLSTQTGLALYACAYECLPWSFEAQPKSLVKLKKDNLNALTWICTGVNLAKAPKCGLLTY